MEIIRIMDPDDEYLEELVPGYVMYLVGSMGEAAGERYLYAAMEGDVMKGYVLFVDYKDSIGIAGLGYIYLLPEVRGAGIGKLLLQTSVKGLWDQGLNFIHCPVLKEEEEGVGFLRKMGFSLYDKRIRFFYTLGHLKEAVKKINHESFEKVRKHIRRYDELTETELEDLKRFASENRGDYYELSNGWEYTRYFASDGKIKGYAPVVKIGEDAVVSLRIWTDNDKAGDYSVPSLLMAMIDDVAESYGDDTILTMDFKKGQSEEAGKRLFGEPMETFEYTGYHIVIE